MSESFYDRFRTHKNSPDSLQQEPEVAPIENEKTIIKEPENIPLKEETTTTQTTEIPKEEKSFDVASINEYYGTSFENADSLKEIFESRDKYKDFDSQLASKNEELTAAQNRYNALLEVIDPEKVLPNKEVAALSQLAEKYPKADIGMLASIRKADLGSLDKLEALVMLDKLTVPSNVSDSIRKAEILRSLGIEEEDISDLSEQDKYRIEREFTTKSRQLEEIKEFQPELKTFDFEAERTQRQQQLETERKSLLSNNEKALNIILDSYKSTETVIKGEDGKDRVYTYQVDSGFKEKFFNDILTKITDSGLKITTENANEIASDINNFFRLQNMPNIIKDAIKQATSNEREQAHQEIHSNSPTNTIEAPTTIPHVPKTMMESFRTGKVKTR